jgi:arylsulfatase A-like enzyme
VRISLHRGNAHLSLHVPYVEEDDPGTCRRFLIIDMRQLILCFLTVFGLASVAGAAPPPNILFIMSDDHAERAISAYGSDLIDTPNIDRIARDGVRFANSFVTNSICAPSRAALLTGKYSHLNGLRDNRDTFDGSQVTFPKLLQSAGYETAIIGKWHLKSDPTGFDEWKILVDQGHYYNPVFIDNGTEVQREGYVTDLITEMALEYLDNRDPSKPFALLYQHKAPHRNWMPHPRHFIDEDHEFPLPETFWDDYTGRPAAAGQDMRIADMWLSLDLKLHEKHYGTEDGTGGNDTYDPTDGWADDYGRMTDEQQAAWDAHYESIGEAFREKTPTDRELAEWKYQRYMRDYLGSVAAVDEGVGQLLDYLEENDLVDNTIVVYTSDQCFYLGEHGWYDKRFMYEESLRTPLIIRYPEEIVPAQVNDDLVLNLDMTPTLLDLAGVDIPPDMQGMSLRPLVNGSQSAEWRDAIYYRYYEFPHGWHSVRPHYGVRTDRYKLIHFEGDMDLWELFDLQADPNELTNLYGQDEYAEIQEALHTRLNELQRELEDLR